MKPIMEMFLMRRRYCYERYFTVQCVYVPEVRSLRFTFIMLPKMLLTEDPFKFCFIAI